MKPPSAAEKKQRRRQSRLVEQETAAAALGPCTAALDLVQAAVDDLGADRAHQHELREAGLAVGQWLADQGRAGQWETVEVAQVIDAVGHTTENPVHREQARETLLFCLATLLGWAGVRGVITVDRARIYLRDIQIHSREPATVNFAAVILVQLASGLH